MFEVHRINGVILKYSNRYFQVQIFFQHDFMNAEWIATCNLKIRIWQLMVIKLLITIVALSTALLKFCQHYLSSCFASILYFLLCYKFRAIQCFPTKSCGYVTFLPCHCLIHIAAHLNSFRTERSSNHLRPNLIL